MEEAITTNEPATSEKKTGKKKMEYVAVGCVALIIGLVLGYVFSTSGLVTTEQADVSSISKKVNDYMNTILAPYGATAEIVNYSVGTDYIMYQINITSAMGSDAVDAYVTKDGEKILLGRFDNLTITGLQGQQEQTGTTGEETGVEETGTTQETREDIGKEGTFTIKSGDVCEVDGKPVIRLFTTTWCPHCVWIKDTFDETVKEYVDAGKIVAYHWELDTGDNTLTDEVETSVPASEEAVYREFNPRGSIPTFVFGCKYYRIGNGYERLKTDEELAQEKAEFKKIIELLLNSSSS